MTDFGFDFRQTSAFVADPAGSTYSIGDSYPQTRNGITFGWTAGVAGARNRSTSVNVRTAGVNFANSPTLGIFRVDLPASGAYNIGCAMGDAGSAQGIQYIEIVDNTTSLWSMTSGAGTSANNYYDINGNLFTSDALWFAGQTLKSLTFATTTLFVKIAKSGVGTTHVLAHLDVNQVMTGSLAQTLASATLSSAATLGITGSLAKTLAGATLSSAATLSITGALGATLGSATLSSAAILAIAGSAAPALGNATLSSAATLGITGSAAPTLGNATLAAAATLSITGSLGATLGSATLSADATIGATGSLSATLASATLTAAAALGIAGSLGATLADASLSSAATLAIAGSLSATLANATLATDGELTDTGITGTLTATLADATLSADATLAIEGAVSATLANAALVSTGAIAQPPSPVPTGDSPRLTIRVDRRMSADAARRMSPGGISARRMR